ncbi:MAG: metal-sensing transcriptional repressor [Bacteroidia bacterium]|jgi:DNA-binding FrmR family transcriptional regulator
MIFQKDLIREIKTRLHSISGQLNGINKMLEEDRDPEEVLIQFKAAKSSLASAETIMLEEAFRMSLAANIAEALDACPGNCGQEEHLALLRKNFPNLKDDELAGKMKEIDDIYKQIKKYKGK